MGAGEFWTGPGGKGIALIATDGTTLSHAELFARAENFRQAIASPEKKLALLIAGADVTTVVAYLGLLRAGHPVLLIAAGSPALPALIEAYQPDLVVNDPESANEMTEGVPLRHTGFETGLALHPDLAVLLTTSGSTGSPKLVRLSHAAVAANARQIVKGLHMDVGDRAVSTLSFAYSFGLSVLNSHLLCGGSLLLSSRTPFEREFWRDLATHHVTTLPGVPFTYDVVRRAGGATLAPACLTKLLQAGGRMAPPMLKWVHDNFAGKACLYVMYGQTEATARIAILAPEELEANMGAVGRALDGATLRTDETGEIIYSGPNVMMGYAECRKDLSRGDELNGVLPTGDLGRLDDEGRLWITGRLKRIAKPFGMRVNLDDIEAQLAGMGTLAVTGDDSSIRISVESGDEALIKQRTQMLMAEMKLPPSLVRLQRVAVLPRNSSGKISYGEL